MGASSSGGGRAARALRLLLLLVMALAAVEYLFGSILDASPLRTYLYTPIYNATQPTLRSREKTHHATREKSSASWPKRLPTAASTSNPEVNLTHTKNLTNNLAFKLNTTVAETNASRLDKPDDATPLLITKIMEGIKNLVTTDDIGGKNDSMPLCEKMPPDLGPVPVNKSDMNLADVEKKYPDVYWGGRYMPPNCTARHRVAIIVPYRDRQQHLAIFLNHMHPFLMRQQLEYGIFIIEQEGNSEFNRAKLFNVGFVESQRLKASGWQCFIFHDVDLLPLDLRNMYSCPRQPRHMSASVDKHKFRLLYEDLFGGVSAMTFEQFSKVNGFSNKYWGWGAEDDDMSYRLKKMNYHIARYPMSVARYAMLDHKPAPPNPKRYQLLSQTSKNFLKDGLTTLEYELVGVVQHHLYTKITVNIDELS